MEYLNLLLNVWSYFCLSIFYANLRRDKNGWFRYWVGFLFYSMAVLAAWAFLKSMRGKS